MFRLNRNERSHWSGNGVHVESELVFMIGRNMQQQESQLKQRLQATLGEATAGLFADGKITWKRSKDRLAPDLEKLGQDHPDLLTRYVKPVPGVRRFTIQPLRQTP